MFQFVGDCAWVLSAWYAGVLWMFTQEVGFGRLRGRGSRWLISLRRGCSERCEDVSGNAAVSEGRL